MSGTSQGQHSGGQPDLRQGIWRQLRVTLLLNVVVPVVLYKLLQPHMSTLHALLIVAVVPALDSAFNLVRYRRPDAFGAFVLIGLLLGAAIVAVGGSPRFILVRESLLIGAMGLAVVVLLRPLLWLLVYVRHFKQARGRHPLKPE